MWAGEADDLLGTELMGRQNECGKSLSQGPELHHGACGVEESGDD